MGVQLKRQSGRLADERYENLALPYQALFQRMPSLYGGFFSSMGA